MSLLTLLLVVAIGVLLVAVLMVVVGVARETR